MTFSAKIDVKAARKAILASPKALFSEMKIALQQSMTAFDARFQEERLNFPASKEPRPRGGGLRRVTGTLSRSFDGVVTGGKLDDLDMIYGSRNVPYAAIHEFGGIINHPGGTAYGFHPVTGRFQFLRKSDEAAAEVLGRTGPHPIPIPERMGMFDLWDEQIDRDVIPRLDRGVQRAIKKIGAR